MVRLSGLSSASSSASLPGLLLAKTIAAERFTSLAFVQRRQLQSEQLTDPIRRQIQERIELFTPKRVAFRSPLKFDERPAAIHHDIHVGFGGRVLGVIE